MGDFHLKPTHAPVRAYYDALERFRSGNFDTEGNIRGAFERLLEHCARKAGWTLVPEYKIARKDQHPAFVDGALVDEFNLPRGYWEAKDSKDDLETEIQKKFKAGYPRTNILFQTPVRAVLYQNGVKALDADITKPQSLIDVLALLFGYIEPHIQEWETAVREFAGRIPEIAAGAMELIDAERKTNKAFIERFAAFADVCRESINPDLKDDAVEKMLVQHLLTERIFRRIFDNPEFTRRNVIAVEIEKVIDSLTKKHFSRDQFLRPLDRFYKAIEEAASQTTSYSEKQSFLNVVYEKFFQRFDAKQADTHGIVYTPQPIVDFMVRSVEELLKQEFGRSLSDEGVHILDPFVGTGTFITRVMQEIKKTRLEKKYASELHCNEIMLLPYYIASMNIEHMFADMAGHYEPFEGICFVDTFEIASQQSLFSSANTERVKKQRNSAIKVIVGNPPYNVGQQDENDNNPNLGHDWVDNRVSATYRAKSAASSTTKLGNLYVRAIRWASDRLESDGIVAFVTNNGFITKRVFDGMRKCLTEEYAAIYVLDLGGDVRDNPKLSGTAHNVFGIQPGVSINVFVKRASRGPDSDGIFYARVDEYWRKERKLAFLVEKRSAANIGWEKIEPRSDGTWIDKGLARSFEELTPITGEGQREGIFQLHSIGVNTNRDAWAFNFAEGELTRNIQRTLDVYNSERQRIHASRLKRLGSLTSDGRLIKWSSSLKTFLKRNVVGDFNSADLRTAMYRPFVREKLYFNALLTHRRGQLRKIYPTCAEDGCNPAISVPGPGNRKLFGAFACNLIPSLDFAFEKNQCFPFYTYDEDGSNRRENITDWALAEFRSRYGQRSISRWDIFHYVYALLHHPEYRTRYAANLKRELPRIPFAPDFARYAAIGKKLMDIHINYEQQPEYPLDRTEIGRLDWRVKKMKLSKDKTKLVYNDFLTFCGIPLEVYEYRLGNRSALEWIVDQYCVSTDKRSGIVNDPNRDDAPEYIVRLIGQVVTVSLETVKLVRELTSLPLLPTESA